MTSRNRRRDRKRGPRRRASVRDPAKLVRIICEGVNTEPGYFRSIIRELRKTAVRLVISGEGADPRTLTELGIAENKKLIREARKSGNSFDKNFEVWVVFDKDDFPQISEARALALANGVLIAMSNPCFELWCIYHYEDHHAPFTNHDCQRKLSDLCGKYDRAGSKRFEIAFCEAEREKQELIIEEAIKRGKLSLIRRDEEGDPLGCPCTEVGDLVETIVRS